MSSLGPFSEQQGITSENFLLRCSEMPLNKLNKGLVCEVFRFLKNRRSGSKWKDLCDALCKNDASLQLHLTAVNLRSSFEKCSKHGKNLRGKSMLDYRNTQFKLPMKKQNVTKKYSSNKKNCSNAVSDASLHFFDSSSRETIVSLGDENHKLKTENLRLTTANADLTSRLQHLELNTERIRSISPHQIKKTLQRKQAQVLRWQVKYKVLRKELNLEIKKNAKLSTSKDALMKVNKAHTKMKTRKTTFKKEINASKKRIVQVEATLDQKRKEIHQLNDSLVELEKMYNEENKKWLELRGQLNRANKAGQAYTGRIRYASYILQNYGVAQKKVSKALKKLYRAFTGTNLSGPLPAYTTQNRFSREMKTLARLQIRKQLENTKNNTLKLDATTKPLGHLTEMEIETEKHGPMLLGIRKQAGGTAQEYTGVIVQTIDKVIGRDAVGSISSMMTDRAVTNSAVERQLSTEYGKRFESFKCNMHPLDTIAKEADKVLQYFEKQSHLKPLATDNSKGESETAILLRAASKMFNSTKWSCRSGLSKHLEERGAPLEGSLFPRYVGNRFNILFLLGGKLFVYKQHILEYFNTNSPTNKVQLQVQKDLDSAKFNSTLRALGLINKLITGPWMQMIAKCRTILDTSEPLYSARQKIESWASNGQLMMNACESAFPGILVDTGVIYTELVKSSDNDMETLSLLEKLCSTICKVMDRQLSDHFPNGKFWNPSKAKIKASRSCSSTNLSGERVFAMSDQEMLRAANARLPYVEAKVMFRKNDTESWLEDMKEQDLTKVIENARKVSITLQKEEKENEILYKDSIAQKLVHHREAQLKREDKERDKLEGWLEMIFKNGGICNTEDDVNRLVNSGRKGDRVQALRAQINIYRHIAPAGTYRGSGGLTKMTETELKNELSACLVNSDKENAVLRYIRKPREFLDCTFRQKWRDAAGKDTWYTGKIIEIKETDGGQLDFKLIYDPLTENSHAWQAPEELLTDLIRGDLYIHEKLSY